MKIQLVSDLHLEFSDIEIKNNGSDLLILGGDIMLAQNLHDFAEDDPMLPATNTQREKAFRFRNFLVRVSRDFPQVIYIAGNHEYYHSKFPLAQDYLRKECSKFENVHFLERNTFFYGDITFIGATLWTDFNKNDPQSVLAAESSMNDYKVIRNSSKGFRRLKALDTFGEHIKTIDYIRKIVKGREEEKFVVVGHHAPSKKSTKPKYEKDYLLNGAYSSDLSEFILDHPQIKLWTHGHTHDFFDYMIGNTRIVCNPRGYEGYEANSNWDPGLIIEV